jgi:hypothetical protein
VDFDGASSGEPWLTLIRASIVTANAATRAGDRLRAIVEAYRRQERRLQVRDTVSA